MLTQKYVNMLYALRYKIERGNWGKWILIICMLLLLLLLLQWLVAEPPLVDQSCCWRSAEFMLEDVS